MLRGMALTYQECNTTLPYTRLEDWLGGAVATTGRNLVTVIPDKVMPTRARAKLEHGAFRTILCRHTFPEIDLCVCGARTL